MKNKKLCLFWLMVISLMTFSCESKQVKLKRELQTEAQAEAQKFWDNSIVKCGDSYYAFGSFSTNHNDFDNIYEFKHFMAYAVEQYLRQLSGRISNFRLMDSSQLADSCFDFLNCLFH